VKRLAPREHGEGENRQGGGKHGKALSLSKRNNALGERDRGEKKIAGGSLREWTRKISSTTSLNL